MQGVVCYGTLLWQQILDIPHWETLVNNKIHNNSNHYNKIGTNFSKTISLGNFKKCFSSSYFTLQWVPQMDFYLGKGLLNCFNRRQDGRRSIPVQSYSTRFCYQESWIQPLKNSLYQGDQSLQTSPIFQNKNPSSCPFFWIYLNFHKSSCEMLV